MCKRNRLEWTKLKRVCTRNHNSELEINLQTTSSAESGRGSLTTSNSSRRKGMKRKRKTTTKPPRVFCGFDTFLKYIFFFKFVADCSAEKAATHNKDFRPPQVRLAHLVPGSTIADKSISLLKSKATSRIKRCRNYSAKKRKKGLIVRYPVLSSSIK